MAGAKVALITSGTATLEAAILKSATGGMLSNLLLFILDWKEAVKVPFISLVNLIQNKAVVGELIQEDFNKQETLSLRWISC